MSALRKTANDREPLDANWVHGGVAARQALSRMEAVMIDLRAMQAVEGGMIQAAEVPGGEREEGMA